MKPVLLAVTVAFIGDQNVNSDAEAVLQLIVNEGADAVVHSGDLGYNNQPDVWEAQIDAYLGPNFPYFASAGNHDERRWFSRDGYQERLAARMNRLGITWDGDLGIRSSFRWNGIFIVQTAPGDFSSRDGDHHLYIRERLAADDSIWSVSHWHRNMELMQVGGKSDDTGWEVYEESRRGGAIVATGHEHSYSRTHLMSSFEMQEVVSTNDILLLEEDDPNTGFDDGKSFVFVSGLGGKSVRDQNLDGPWWASIYTSDQGATFGALFGVFGYGGNPYLARFYFKNIDGEIVDEFFVQAANPPAPSVSLFQGPGTIALATLLGITGLAMRRRSRSRE